MYLPASREIWTSHTKQLSLPLIGHNVWQACVAVIGNPFCQFGLTAEGLIVRAFVC